MDDRIVQWLPVAVPLLAVLLIGSAYMIWAVAL